MQKASLTIFALPMLLLASMAQAQTAGTITFSANKTSSSSAFAPVLTWSTTPVASSCTASGGWTGTKFASGSETLPSISSNKSYTLTCSWGNGTATVNWTKPTKNTDGSNLTDLSGFKIVYGNSASSLNQSKSVAGASATSTSIGSLGAGTWYFAVRAVNTAGAESANSNTGSKTITAATAAKTVNITVTAPAPPPPPPVSGYKTTSSGVYDVVTKNGKPALGVKIGKIAIGKPCDGSYLVGEFYNKVSLSDVTVSTKPRSSVVVAHCVKS